MGRNYNLAGSGITSTAATLTLTAFTTPDGTNLSMSDFGTIGYLVIEPRTSNVELVSFTGVTINPDGTATITGLTRGLSFKAPYTLDAALKLAHAGGSVVIISNPPQHYDKLAGKDNDETITGDWTFSGRAITIPTETSSDIHRAASIEYVNSIITSGGVDASNTVKGITKLSVAAASPTNPIAVGDNDPRVPTQNENDALVGTSGTPVSTSNKLIDNGDSSATGSGSKVVRGTSGLIDISWIPYGTTADKLIKLDGSAKLPAVDGSQLTNIVAPKHTVNADENMMTYFTTTIPPISIDGSGGDTEWSGTFGNHVTYGDYATFSWTNHGGTDSGDRATVIYYPVSGKKLRIKYMMKITGTVGGVQTYDIGIFTVGYIEWNGTNWVLTNGTTSQTISGVTFGNANLFELVFDGNTMLYVNGVLKATISGVASFTNPTFSLNVSGTGTTLELSEIVISREI